MTATGPLKGRPRDERGSGGDSLEAVILFPAVLLLMMLVAAAGIVALAHDGAESAASAAARAASMERDPASAVQAANAVATANTNGKCGTTNVTVDTSSWAVPVGQNAHVEVTVTCHVLLSGAVPGAGSRTLTSTATAPLDVYRQRGR